MVLYLYALPSSRGTVQQSIHNTYLSFTPDFINFIFVCGDQHLGNVRYCRPAIKSAASTRDPLKWGHKESPAKVRALARFTVM